MGVSAVPQRTPTSAGARPGSGSACCSHASIAEYSVPPATARLGRGAPEPALPQTIPPGTASRWVIEEYDVSAPRPVKRKLA